MARRSTRVGGQRSRWLRCTTIINLLCLATPACLAFPLPASGGEMTAASALVTGSTDGIGRNTALRLAQKGYRTFVHGRSEKRVRDAVEWISSQLQGGDGNLVEGITADISTLRGMSELAREVKQRTDSLHVLVNNAGIFEPNRQLTEDNIELVLATNVLPVHVLTRELLPLLRNAGKARVVNVSSISQGYEAGLGDLQFLQGGYNDHRSYSLSKLCVAMLNFEQHERWGSKNLTFNTLDPGTVNTKMLLAGWGACGIGVSSANDEAFLATAPELDGVSGQYFVSRSSRRANPACYDPVKRKSLWDEMDALAKF